MIRKIFKMIGLAFAPICSMILCLKFMQFNMATAQNKVDDQDFKIYASCDTYIRIDAPGNLSTQYSFVTSKNSPPQLVGTLRQGAGEIYDSNLMKPDFPRQGWYSVLFEGPTFGIDRFCYGTAKTDRVILSYKPVSHFIMAYSEKPEFSAQEIDKIGSNASRSVIRLKSVGPNKSHISAGRNSNNPYWLTLSHNYNFHEPIETSLQYTIP